MGWMKKVLFAFGTLAAILSPAAALGDETFERALSLASEKRYAEAREVLDPLLAREPGHPRARLLHGILRARAGRVSEAIDIFEALRRDHPDMSEPYNNLAVLYAVDGRLDEARTTLLAALERRPDAVAYANLGDVYTKLARRAYRQARELDPAGNARPDDAADAAFPLAGTPAADTQAEPAPAAMAAQAGKAARAGKAAQAGKAARAAMAAQETDGEPGGSVEKPPAPAMRTAVVRPELPPPPGIELTDVAAQPVAAESSRPAAAGTVSEPLTVAEGSGESGTEQLESGAAAAALASAAASTPEEFCAHAGGFDGRHAVAEAALWLRSYGAEIVEVRHEKQNIASSYRVYLPPFPSREEAAVTVREIRKRGVSDVVVIKDGDLANGISFGIYAEADNMHRRVAALGRLGYSVRSQAEDVDAIEQYVIKTRADGTPVDLAAAWASQFPDYSLDLADCG